MSQDNPTVLVEIDGPVATLTLHRPKGLNAISSELIDDLGAALDAVEADGGVRAIILTGSGKAFAAGADIAEMADYGKEQAWAFSTRGQRTFARMEKLPIPVLAAVNGFALGGGCELAMCCDVIYASDRAKFGQPEVNLAVTPGFGGTQRLQRLVGTMMARELIFTGRIFGAEEAVRLGLAARVIPGDELLPTVRQIAADIATKGPVAVGLAKSVIQAGAALPLDDANALEAEAFGASFATEDQKEGMRAFLDKRTATFKGR